jgi:hypothetical protein
MNDTQPVVERTIVKAGGIIATDQGRPIWPPQADLPDLAGPEQIYRELSPDESYWSDAARAKAEGWAVPLPALDESILMREAFRQSVRRLTARRNPDVSRMQLATKRAADLTATDPQAEIMERLIDLAIDGFLQANLGVDWSPINSWSYALERHWLQLLHANQRAVLRSLLGRDTPAANRLRATAERMALSLAPPEPDRAAYVIMP